MRKTETFAFRVQRFVLSHAASDVRHGQIHLLSERFYRRFSRVSLTNGAINHSLDRTHALFHIRGGNAQQSAVMLTPF